jgi:hypothetical protein
MAQPQSDGGRNAQVYRLGNNFIDRKELIYTSVKLISKPSSSYAIVGSRSLNITSRLTFVLLILRQAATASQLF